MCWKPMVKIIVQILKESSIYKIDNRFRKLLKSALTD